MKEISKSALPEMWWNLWWPGGGKNSVRCSSQIRSWPADETKKKRAPCTPLTGVLGSISGLKHSHDRDLQCQLWLSICTTVGHGLPSMTVEATPKQPRKPPVPVEDKHMHDKSPGNTTYVTTCACLHEKSREQTQLLS